MTKQHYALHRPTRWRVLAGWLLLVGSLGGWCAPAQAGLTVLATVPEWGALAQTLGGDGVTVYTATTALQDPHRIEARPSLIARARRAQLVIATGAELEIGWLPLVLRESGNAAIQAGQPGYFEAASVVKMLDVPARLDRADGDVHGQGNPHIQLDPRRLAVVAEALAKRMVQLDPAGAEGYQQRAVAFAQRWRTALAAWEQKALPLRGMLVWEQHRSFTYLYDWLGIRSVGTLEPKPGMEPTAGQLSEVVARQKVAGARMILLAAYQPDAHARWVAERTGLPVVTLPFTVGGNAEASDLYGLFDDTLQRLLSARKE